MIGFLSSCEIFDKRSARAATGSARGVAGGAERVLNHQATTAPTKPPRTRPRISAATVASLGPRAAGPWKDASMVRVLVVRERTALDVTGERGRRLADR